MYHRPALAMRTDGQDYPLIGKMIHGNDYAMDMPLPPKPFYFIRHGESEWNALDQFAGGQVDTTLTPTGIQQANDAVQIFETLHPSPSHIIHSPLSRAKKTATILNQAKCLPMIEMPSLREVDAGDWAGLPNAEAKKRWAEGLTPVNGENLNDFANRIQTVFRKILSNHTYSMPIIAAHGRIINALDTIYGLPVRSLQVKNCQVLKYIPTEKQGRQYPWDVYICTIKNGQISEDLAAWSQM